ncbi:MAG: ParM/StbA family protein [Thermoflexales bacterium]|nr:ParM/StbA family protein [Thermoflexales bacterium]
MANLIYAGIDAGFGFTKIIVILNGRLRTFVFPSVLGLAESTVEFSVAGGSRRKPSTATFKGTPYFYGEDAILQSRVTTGRQDRDRIGSDEELLLALIALARLDITRAHIVTGLPVAWLRDKDKLIRTWTGTHQLAFGKRELAITIENVTVIPQPLGGYYSWALDNAGQPAQSKEMLNGALGLLDIGWNTSDLTGLRAIRPVQQWCGGEQVGMRRVIEIIDARLRAEHGITRRPHNLDAALRDGQAVTVYGQPVDVSGIAQQARAMVAADIQAAATRLWGSADAFDRVLIFGGGAAGLSNELRKAFPHNGVLLPQPELANALGFARLAVRQAVEIQPKTELLSDTK